MDLWTELRLVFAMLGMVLVAVAVVAVMLARLVLPRISVGRPRSRGARPAVFPSLLLPPILSHTIIIQLNQYP